MVANISDFISKFPKDLARPCNFTVKITAPILDSYSSQELTFKCEASELPSRTFSLVEQKTYGPVQQFPIQNFYDKHNLTFLCSDDMREKKLFDRWMDNISDSTISSAFGVKFDFKYKDTYAGQIEIIQYDVTGKESFNVKLIEAFPISVHPLKLDWGADNEVHKLMVTFAYRYTQ
jgi:hypothetical protein